MSFTLKPSLPASTTCVSRVVHECDFNFSHAKAFCLTFRHIFLKLFDLKQIKKYLETFDEKPLKKGVKVNMCNIKEGKCPGSISNLVT